MPGRGARRGDGAAERFLLSWRGEADPAHVARDRRLLGLRCRARHERLDLHRSRRRVDRRRLAAALSARSGRCSGPLHGGAPARVLRMLDEVEAMGDEQGVVTRTAASA